jgi:glycosyltransferase involved in cell wall biosynthesis
VALDATPLLGPRTGVGSFCAGALAALAARPDVEVRAFAVTWRRRHLLAGELPAGASAVENPMPARPLHLAWRHASVPPVEWWTGEVDVVHGTNFVVPPARRAARVVTVHDLTTVRFPELCDDSTRRYPELVRRAVARGAWVHTPSQHVADEVVELLGAPPARVRAVAHGIRRWARREHGNQPPVAHRYVLALGTVEPRKDLPSLVSAFDRVAPGDPDLRLVIAGPDGWGVDALERAIRSSPVADRVVRLDLLARAEVFAYPSVYEGFGLPPLEAMAAGVPVVATSTGALAEVLGDAALLVPVRDPGELACALDTALHHEATRKELVEKGRDRASLYSWEACAEGLTRMYAQAAA